MILVELQAPTFPQAAPTQGLSAPTARIRTLLVNLLMTGISLSVALLLAEAAIRYIRPQQLIVPRPELYRADNVFGWTHVPNADTTINTGEGLVRIATDSRGYRVTQNALPAGVTPHPRVLMLGDSFLEATAVESDKVVSGVLSSKISQMTGQPAVVDNTGVGGWDPNHYRLEAVRALSSSDYDLGIVLLYVGNDIVTTIADSYPARQPSQRHFFRIPGQVSKKEFVDAFLYPLNDTLETSSHLFQFMKNAAQVPLGRLGLSANYFPPIFQLEEVSSDRWDVTTTICQRIEQEFRSRGIPVLFVLIPAPYQVDAARFEAYTKAFQIDSQAVDLDMPGKLLGRRFQAHGLQLLDPLNSMRERKQLGQDLYGEVDGHLNAKGHEVLAELLLPEVQRMVQQRRKQ